MLNETDVLIIGAGIAGLSIARELSKYDVKVTVVEKEPDVGWGQSKVTYGIRHPGSRWPHGSLAQRMIYESQKMWDRLIEELEIEFRLTGELVVAFTDEEVAYIYALKAQGEKNGVEGLEILKRDAVVELEPHVNPTVCAALYKKTAGVFNPFEVISAFYENSLANGVEFHLETEVAWIAIEKSKFLVGTNKGDFIAKCVVNAAGLSAQKIAEMIGDESFKISFETKSTCVILDRFLGRKVRHIIAGIPDVKSFLRFSLVVPTYHHNLLIYTPIPEPARGINDRDVERRALEATLRHSRSLVRDLDFENHILTAFSGVTARNNRGDLIIEASQKHPAFIHVALPPPGLTSAPAVAKRVVELIKNGGLSLKKKPDFDPVRKAIKRIRSELPHSWHELLKDDHRYGRIVCRCEKISEAEIVDAIRRGATTLDGVKFRTRAGMGRCQGNFCACEIAEILSRELHRPYQAITKKGRNSYFVKRR